MKSRCYSNLFPIIIIVLASPFLLMAQSNYRIQTLGELGGSSASANGINDRGWITGAANLPGDLTSMATLWLKGVPVPLGTLQNGPNSAIAWPVKSNNGIIVPGADGPLVGSVALYPSVTSRSVPSILTWDSATW